MTAIIVFVIFFAALSVAALMGWTVDSRDPAFGMGPVTRRDVEDR